MKIQKINLYYINNHIFIDLIFPTINNTILYKNNILSTYNKCIYFHSLIALYNIGEFPYLVKNNIYYLDVESVCGFCEIIYVS